jgi:autotransporter passenger strand-loop-strand repeat protein
VLKGGTLRDDGDVNGARIFSGGTLDVLKGGYAGGVFVFSGGRANVSGQLVETVVSHGGTLTALAGDVTSATIDGTLSAVTVTSLTVKSGGVAHLLAPSSSTSQGSLTSATVERGGKLIMARTSASHLIVAGGVATLRSGGLALSPIVRYGGTLNLSSGATTSNVTLQGGKEIVTSGGIVAGTTIFGKNATLAIVNTAPVLTARGFKATDKIDLKSFQFSSLEKFSFMENAAKTKGTLTIVDGALTAKITLFGNYTAAGFTLAPDATGGTAVTTNYSPSSSSQPVLVANHH